LSIPAVHVTFRGWYDEAEDDFTGKTYYTRSLAEDETPSPMRLPLSPDTENRIPRAQSRAWKPSRYHPAPEGDQAQDVGGHPSGLDVARRRDGSRSRAHPHDRKGPTAEDGHFRNPMEFRPMAMRRPM
jgi:hypothetical protein